MCVDGGAPPVGRKAGDEGMLATIFDCERRQRDRECEISVPDLVNDLVLEFHQFEMGDVEFPHGANGAVDCLLTPPSRGGGQLPTDLSQGPEDARPVEALPFAMFAVIHDHQHPTIRA
jgi:hypothetical protein